MFAGFVMGGRDRNSNGFQVMNVYNINLDKSGNASDEPIFIHFDFEGYEAIFLGKPDENGIFSTNRMVPTGELDYFYTGN